MFAEPAVSFSLSRLYPGIRTERTRDGAEDGVSPMPT